MSPRAAAVWAGAVLFVGAWTLARPVASTPDADDHLLYAASLWRGQLTSTDVEVRDGEAVAVESKLEVPAAYAALRDRVACFDRGVVDPDECAVDPGDDQAPTIVGSRAGRYPPTYHLLVGAPTRLASALDGAQGARWMSAVLNGSLLGAAVWLARRWRRDTVLLLALTPSLGQLSALVNPSGMELTGSLLLWVGALRVVEVVGDEAATPDAAMRTPPDIDAAAWGAVAVGGSALVLARPLGPVLLASVLALAVLYAAGRGTAWEGVRDATRHAGRVRGARWALDGLGVACLLALGWILVRDPAGALAGIPAPELGAGDIVREMLDRTGSFVRGMVWFGPEEGAQLWMAAVAMAAIAAVWRGRWGARLAVAGVVAWTLVVPILAVLRTASDVGVVWQGRYSQPVTAGAVVVASFVLGRTLPPATERVVRAAVVAVTFVVTTWAVQERVASQMAFPNAASSWFPSPSPDGWAPLVPAMAVVALAALGWLLLALPRASGQPPVLDPGSRG